MMLKTYALLAWRHLLANKITSTINMVGLSVAVACAITTFLILKNFSTLDDFHAKGDRLFMVEYTTEENGELRTYGDAPALLASALKTDCPQVKQTVRVEREGVQVFNKETIVDEQLTYADTNFFDAFTFPLRYGTPVLLRDPSALIISAEMAEKYFPGQLPVGQPFTLVTSTREAKQFTIQGVAEAFPTNTGFRFNFLTGYHPSHTALKNQDWSTHIQAVFVELNQPTDVAALTKQMSRYVARYNAKNRENPIRSLTLDNLRHPAPNAYEVRRRPAEANDPYASAVFVAIAFVMMAVSCANYVNIALGSVSRRLKEIGMRKVLGGTRRQLIGQFMAENLLLCAIALGFGLLITQVFLVPLFNRIMVLDIAMNFDQNKSIWVFLVGILLFTALASGGYPALYVSSFRPIVIFAGRLTFSSKRKLGRALLVGQFALAFVAVIIGVVLSNAGRQWQRLHWGYDPSPSLVLRLTDSTQYTILKNELLQNAAIEGVAAAEFHVGESLNSQQLTLGGVEKWAMRYDVSPEYVQTLGLELARGQFFSPQRPAENKQSVLINETFVRTFGLKEPIIGRAIRVDSQLVTVAGVLADVKLMGSGAMRPALFRVAEAARYQYMLVRFVPGSGPRVVAALERTWKAKFPHIPLSHFYQKDVFDSFNSTVETMAVSFGYLSGLALLIACMGLYGLATQHFVQRVKEVSVRKVLGATVAQVLLLVNREFMLLLLLASGLANAFCVAGFAALLRATEQFTSALRIEAGPFLVANALVLFTAVMSVGWQSWKIATIRLAESLKNVE
ncbi:ABC transporter permease [Fibrella forsythiae]|uniref:ABC transporter permease n=1 Tax=Fibrella forsythiae TaxID=2817061 RepID=A0ABS3JH60_9BACT|nr:ABC transporter permease [Fibrella forsythiae]MBO0948227.1 ABC transporter permease [Fibrella forsythiae]